MSEELKKEAQEAGDMHSEGCCVNTEYGCDDNSYDCCDNMTFINSLIDKATLAERERCVEECDRFCECSVEDGITTCTAHKIAAALNQQDDE